MVKKLVSETYYYDASGYAMISGSGDNGTVMPGAARAVVESLGGYVVSRQYTVYLPGERRDIQCQRYNAQWDADDNLKTITKTYTNGPLQVSVLTIDTKAGFLGRASVSPHY
jgi:hypothetical protein